MKKVEKKEKKEEKKEKKKEEKKMEILNTLAMGYHTAKGVLRVMRPSRLRFKPTDFLVRLHVERIIGGGRTIEDVPNIGNLREVVQQEVNRILKEAEEKKGQE